MSDSNLIRGLKIAAANRLPERRPMAPADQAYQNKDLDRAYWYSHAPTPPRKGRYSAEDDTLYRIPTQMQEPEGARPQNRAFVTANFPQWNQPTYWAEPFEETFTACVPTWEEDYNIGTIQTTALRMAVIKSVSYECISGLAQYDLFQFNMWDPANRAEWEDMIIDPLIFDPSRRHVFSGYVSPLPLEAHVDRDRTVRFTVRARGLVAIDGTSNHNPGDPLLPNAHFRLNVQGWWAPLRRNLDGGPRPTDLGNMEFMPLDPERYLEAE